MPVPTITAVAPAVGPTCGGNYIELTGTNFQLPVPVLVPGQITAEPPPSFRLTIGGTEVAWKNVMAFSDTRVGVKVPPSAIMPRSADTLPVDITLEHLDTLGVAIPGESVTVAAAYTYERFDISGQNTGALVSLINSLGQRLSTDVVRNTAFSSHPDWDRDTTSTYVDAARLPALLISGPSMQRDALYDDGDAYVYSGILPDPTEFFEQRSARGYTLQFEITGLAANTIVAANMMELFHQWVERVDTITYTDLIGDEVSLDLRYASGGEPSIDEPTQAERNSGITSWSTQIVLRGFQSRQLAGVQYDMVNGISHELLTIDLQEVGQLVDNSGSKAPVSPGSGTSGYQVPPAPGSPGSTSSSSGGNTPPAPVSPGP